MSRRWELLALALAAGLVLAVAAVAVLAIRETEAEHQAKHIRPGMQRGEVFPLGGNPVSAGGGSDHSDDYWEDWAGYSDGSTLCVFYLPRHPLANHVWDDSMWLVERVSVTRPPPWHQRILKHLRAKGLPV